MRRLLGVVGCALLLAACGAETDSAPKPRPEPTVTSAPPSRAATKAAQPLTCEQTWPVLLARAGNVIVGDNGPFLGSTLVHAARTKTGDWYVLAVDRASVYDNGRQSGSGSRALGLTNATRGHVDGSTMIRIGGGRLRGRVRMDWSRVSWTGDTLAAGKAAARRAIQCLDAESD